MPATWTPPPGWEWWREPWLVPDQAAYVLKISRDEVDAMIERGDLSAVDLGKRTRHSYHIPTQQMLDDLSALGREQAESRRPALRSVRRDAQ